MMFSEGTVVRERVEEARPEQVRKLLLSGSWEGVTGWGCISFKFLSGKKKGPGGKEGGGGFGGSEKGKGKGVRERKMLWVLWLP